MNTFITDNAPPASAPVLLAVLGVKYDSKTVKEFAAYTAEFERITSQLNEYNRPAGEAAFARIRGRAEADPSTENLRQLAENSRESIAAKFAAAHTEIFPIRASLMKRAAPLVLRIRAHVLSVLDAELTKIERDSRERFARLGCKYQPAEDSLLNQIARLRTIVENVLACNTCFKEPGCIVALLGPITAK